MSTSTFGFKISLKDLPIDTDGDSFYDYKDLDSDDDSCYDTFEAGFNDPDNNGRLGIEPITLDSLGRVIGQGGYLTPLDADSNSIFDFQEATALVSITSHPTSLSVCVSDTNSFSVVTSDPVILFTNGKYLMDHLGTILDLHQIAYYQRLQLVEILLATAMQYQPIQFYPQL